MTYFDLSQRARRATNRQQCGFREAGVPFARSPAPPTNLLSRVARIESGSGVAGQVAGPVCGVYMQTTQGGGARGERGEGAGSE